MIGEFTVEVDVTVDQISEENSDFYHDSTSKKASFDLKAGSSEMIAICWVSFFWNILMAIFREQKLPLQEGWKVAPFLQVEPISIELH